MTKKFFSALAAIALLALSACTQEELNQFLNSVNSIKLDQAQVEMTVGETLNLIATVDPFKGDTKVVTWTSSSPDVASVKGTEVPDVVGINMPAGEVTALKEGETTITAKAGDKTATCKVIVKKKADDGGGNTGAVTELKLDKAEVHMSPGQVWQLNATVKPEGASISWSSNKTDVATVDREGKVTAVALGEAFITASAGEKSAQCLVKVEREVAIEGISLNKSSLTLKEGETFQLVATILPETATPQTIEWISSIPAVATVNENGLVTAVRKGGPATIWAVIGRGSGHDINAKCDVTVISDGPSVESITVTPSAVTIKATEETILTATVTPAGTGAEIKWVSDNTSIAKVEKISDTQAKVTGVGEGTVKVIASVGDVFDYSEVTVEKKASGGGEGGEGGEEMISLNKTELQLGFYETFQLVATLRPEDASAQITWTSSNEDVVLVSNGRTPAADGTIKPAGTVIAKNKEGQSIVTATVGSLSASCTVTVSSGSIVPVQSISLNKTELTLQVGQQFELIATILPGNATNKQVSWASSARSYQLSLADNGLSCVIGALAECEATITVRSADNPAQLYATCKVTVTGGSSGDSSEEVVDLGLPSGLKWRSMNVGASKPEDYGDYFAWGETSPKSSYTSSNYKYKSSDIYGDGIGKVGKTLIAEDDAATVNVGSDWRTPKFSEWKELKEKCTWTWTTRNGVKGMQVTGPSGKSIFLPAGGCYGSSVTYRGTQGHYWSASYGSDIWAEDVEFMSTDVNYGLVDRCIGRSIRPVKN
ncbi:MAG: Ig-like domain-containing protein [Bacteroidales bacterium]|nr:Ig-like domain-containing protein [Bacteroidales bacterium]